MENNSECGICAKKVEPKKLFMVKILVNHNQWINDLTCEKCLDALNRHLKRFIK